MLFEMTRHSLSVLRMALEAEVQRLNTLQQ
jgi:hypothetical protein